LKRLLEPPSSRVLSKQLRKIIPPRSRMPACFRPLALLACLMIVVSCSGGGSSSSDGTGTISALSLPDRIALSSVEHSNNPQASLLARSMGHARAFSDAGSDYTNQTKDVWVEDTDALDMINDILGVVQDTAYDQFVNAGPYKALVKKVGDSQESQSGSSTTDTTTEQLMELVVDVTRESNSSPMTIKVWVMEEDGPGGQAMLIRGYFTVTAGVSTTYPYGKMEAHFKGVALDENGAEVDPDNPVMTIALKVDADAQGNVVVESIDEGAESEGAFEFAWNNQLRLVANSGLTEGRAYVRVYESDPFAGESDSVAYIAYDPDYFKIGDEVFDKNTLVRKVYRYRLFEAETGDKVTHNGGFPIQFENGDHGYIGYYGLWANQGVNVENGDTVTDFDGNSYTVFKVAGKLRKNTRASTTLGDLVGVEMSRYACAGEVCGDQIIAWDGNNFNIIGTRSMETGQVVYAAGGPATFANEWDGAWCEALKAYLSLGRLDSPTNATTLYYYVEETIDPSLAQNLTLYCWGPAPGQSQEEYWSQPPENRVEHVYTFDAETLVLKDQNGDPVLAEGDDIWLSPLTTASYPAEEAYQAQDAEVYYTWSSGADSWNQFVTLQNGNGTFLGFEPPLHFTYTHQTANDLNGDDSQNGKKFRLDYDGTELQMPWHYDAAADQWQPVINLKDGTLLTDDLSNQYVVKGIEIGVMMAAADPADAAYLPIDTSVPAPTLTYDATKTALVGAMPEAELEVIKGELIE
jgi:hypothetical protein